MGAYENQLCFYHGDHLSSTQMITDLYGNVVQQVLYAPFGEVITEYNAYWHQGKIPDYMFNAKEKDEESGMYYYEARYYNPPSFISRDPLFEKYPTLSPYCYTANNPVKYIDPDGRKIRNPRNLVLSNRTLMKQMRAFDRSVSRISGKNINSYTFTITGGDRYRKNGKIYSSSNNKHIPTSVSKSLHLQEEGAKAVDLSLPNNIPYDVLKQAAEETGFRIDPSGKYSSWFHIDLKNYEGEMDYAGNNYRPTDADFDHSQDISINETSNSNRPQNESKNQWQNIKQNWQELKKSFKELKQTRQDSKARKQENIDN
jgi:RHS repeat-associated protein